MNSCSNSSKTESLKDLAQFNIELKEKASEKLKEGKKVKANISFEGSEHEVALTGGDHAYSLKVTDGTCFNGMKKFKLFKTNGAQGALELAYHETMKAQGFVTTRYNYFALSMNAVNYNDVFAYEEGMAKRLLESNGRKEGLIFKFDTAFQLKAIGLKKDDSVLQVKADYASFKFKAALAGELPLEQVVSIPVLAKFLAYSDAYGATKQLNEGQMRWFYNPIIGKFEPVVRLLGEQQESLSTDLLLDDGYTYLRSFFANKDLKQQYLLELKVLSSDQSLFNQKRVEQLLKEGELADAETNVIEMDMSAVNSDDIWLKEANYNSFDFVQENGSEVVIKKGKHTLSSDLIIPSNKTFVMNEGTELVLQNKALILCYGNVQLIGSENEKVKIVAGDKTAQGLFALNTSMDNRLESKLDYVEFYGMAHPKKADWSITGGLSFYQHNVEITNSYLADNHAGDDCLNIIRGDFKMDHVIFENSFSDAFDGDFTKGTVSNTSYTNIGNDGVDVSGSQIRLENVTFDNIEDKAISAGENSQIDALGIDINEAELAITSKDQSTVTIADVNVENCKVGFTVFQKKPEFGKAKVVATKYVSKNVEVPYLLEKGSSLTVNGEVMKADDEKVKAKLYGAEYGKASQR